MLYLPADAIGLGFEGCGPLVTLKEDSLAVFGEELDCHLGATPERLQSPET